MGIEFKPVVGEERNRLMEALRRNADDGAALTMARSHTGFVGTTEQVSDDEVVQAIRSVPCHYARTRIRITDAEGALVEPSAHQKLMTLRDYQKKLFSDWTASKERTKSLKAELLEVSEQVGVAIDELDQPPLPFANNGEEVTP